MKKLIIFLLVVVFVTSCNNSPEPTPPDPKVQALKADTTKIDTTKTLIEDEN